MKNVFIYNNTVIRTREPNVDRYVFWTFVPESTFVTVRNNIFVLAEGIQVFGPYKKPVGHQRTGFGEQVHDHNIYFSPNGSSPGIIGIAPGKEELIADPLFIDYKNGNYRLKRNSPARNRGEYISINTDLDGYPVPKNEKPDIGAYGR